MSTSIVFRTKAYTWNDAYGDTCYLLMEERGDNNVIERRTKKVVRDWFCIASGPAYSVYGQIAQHVRPFAGGMKHFAHISWGHNYEGDLIKAIRRYSRELKQARPIEEAYKDFPELETEIKTKVA